MSSAGAMGTFYGRVVNPRFNNYRKKIASTNTVKYLMVKTDDLTGKVSEIRYDLKGNITSQLKNYKKIDKDTFIGERDFVVIFKELWG